MQVGLPGTTTSEINVAPMIDVLLVLLVIFMIAQTLLQVIPLHVPAPAHPAGPPPPAIVLELGKDHTYRINGSVVRKQSSRTGSRLCSPVESRSCCSFGPNRAGSTVR